MTPTIFLISGDKGTGKTTLIRDLRQLYGGFSYEYHSGKSPEQNRQLIWEHHQFPINCFIDMTDAKTTDAFGVFFRLMSETAKKHQYAFRLIRCLAYREV